MSNIYKSDNTLNDLVGIKESFSNGIFEENLNETLNYLIPKKDGKSLIRSNIKSIDRAAAKFVPSRVCIYTSVNKLNEWLDNNTSDFYNSYKIDDKNVLRDYLLLFVLTHEIEHSYQYLMGKGIINSPNEMLKNAYNGLMSLLIRQDYIIPRPVTQIKRDISLILYKKDENNYLLERNANIESTDLLMKLSKYESREDMYNLFSMINGAFKKVGYIDNNNGSIYETYKSILMFSKYKKFYEEIEMSEEERIRYGFSLKKNISN